MTTCFFGGEGGIEIKIRKGSESKLDKFAKI